VKPIKATLTQNTPLKRLSAFLNRRRAYQTTLSELRITDGRGKLLGKRILPFSHTLHAVALPNGRVIIMSAMGEMYCYSLAHRGS
jgi:hypothetical protein